MNIERKCLSCWFAAQEEPPANQPQLIGHRQWICMASPPSPTAVPTGAGSLAMITAYPQINDKTPSCARWTPIPSAEAQAIMKAGANDGNN